MSSINEIHNVTVGDVFLVPVDDASGYIGQIIGSYSAAIYVVILDSRIDLPLSEVDSDSARDSALETRPIFGTLTYDSRFRSGMWKLIGHRPTNGKHFLPAYKTGDPGLGNCMVESFDSRQRRIASVAEWETLPHRGIISAMAIDRAVLWHAGRDQGGPFIEKLRYDDQVMLSQDIFPEK